MYKALHARQPESAQKRVTSTRKSSRAKKPLQRTAASPLLLSYTQAWGKQPPPWLRLGGAEQPSHKEDHIEPIQKKENNTGLPDTLKAGVENLSGLSMDDVHVHYNSSKPAEVQALAYTRGSEIHVGPGQEKHLAHEAWHVVQQKQGRVQSTMQMKGVAINDDQILEGEADVMGAQAHARQLWTPPNVYQRHTLSTGVLQRVMSLVKVPFKDYPTHMASEPVYEERRESGKWTPKINYGALSIHGMKPIVEVSNPGVSLHSEELLLMDALQSWRVLGSNQISALLPQFGHDHFALFQKHRPGNSGPIILYTERRPCGNKCAPGLKKALRNDDSVFYTVKSNEGMEQLMEFAQQYEDQMKYAMERHEEAAPTDLIHEEQYGADVSESFFTSSGY